MDPVTAIANGVGSLFSFLDGVIYSPQEQARDKLSKDQQQLERDQLTFQQQQAAQQERLANLSLAAKNRQNSVILLSVGTVVLGAVTITALKA